jgi:hypothetical protein
MWFKTLPIFLAFFLMGWLMDLEWKATAFAAHRSGYFAPGHLRFYLEPVGRSEMMACENGPPDPSDGILNTTAGRLWRAVLT